MRRIARNLGLLMSGKTVAGLISLIYIALSARMLGVTDYGVLNLVHGYATFMGALVAFSGFHPVVTYGTQALHDQDVARLGRLLAFMALLEGALALIAIVTTAALAYPIGLALGWSPDTIAFAPLYSLAILATVRATPWGLLQITGRFDLIAAHQAMMPLVRLVGTLLILATGGGLQSFLIVWLVASVAEGLSMWAIAWWVCRARGIGLVLPGYETMSAAIAENPGLVRFLTITNFDRTLREFAPKAIPLIIGWVSGAAAAGLYALAIRIAAVLTQPPQLLGQAAYSVIQKQVAAGQIERARRTIDRAAWLVLLAGGAVAAIMSLGAEHIIMLVAGREFLAGATLLMLVLAARAIAAATPLWSTALTSLGRPGSSLQINLACNLLTLPLLPALLTMAGTEGAGYHALIQAVGLAGLLWFANRQAITTNMKGSGGQQLADFWRYGVQKTWRKAVAATLSPIYARLHGSTDKEPGTFTTRYGVRMIGNWRDRTFRYCMFATYGHDLADILANQPHDFQFVDIGANQGLYSLLAGMNPRCRRIVAFEPVPNTFALLRGNIATNNLADRANLHKLGIAADAGRTVIKVNEAHSGTASLADQTTYAANETVTIQTINAAVLDDILGTEWPMVVKVDVEGLEQQVIAELAKARAFRAVSGIFYEIDERWSDASAIQALLVSAGFGSFRRFGRGHHYDVYAER